MEGLLRGFRRPYLSPTASPLGGLRGRELGFRASRVHPSSDQSVMDTLLLPSVLVAVTIPRQSRGPSGCEPLKAADWGR